MPTTIELSIFCGDVVATDHTEEVFGSSMHGSGSIGTDVHRELWIRRHDGLERKFSFTNSTCRCGKANAWRCASFIYDPMGRRISKTVSGSTTQYLHDLFNPVEELDNTATPTANLLTGLGIDQFFSRTDALGARHLLTDALGSTLALTDDAGAIKTEYTYSAYGTANATGESNANPFQYTGRENDGTGLYYYRARYYDPLTSRFIAEDPIGLRGGINLYNYVNNNPVRFSDPLGMVANENISPCAPPGCPIPRQRCEDACNIAMLARMPFCLWVAYVNPFAGITCWALSTLTWELCIASCQKCPA